MEVALDQCGTANERRLAIVDKNRDLHLTQVRVYGAARKTCKLGECACVYVCVCVCVSARCLPVLLVQHTVQPKQGLWSKTMLVALHQALCLAFHRAIAWTKPGRDHFRPAHPSAL